VPLTNAEKQRRHRARVAEKLNDLKRLGAARDIAWLGQTSALRVGLDDRRAGLVAEQFLVLLGQRWGEGGCFAAEVIAEMEQMLTKRRTKVN
jgi:hypothetical protein